MSPVRAFLDLLRAVRGSVTVAASRASRRTRLVAGLVGLAIVALIGVAAIAALTESDDGGVAPTARGSDADVVPDKGDEPPVGESPAATPTPVPGGDATRTNRATPGTGEPAPPGTATGDAPAAGPSAAEPPAGTTGAPSDTAPTTSGAGAPTIGPTTTRPRPTTTTATPPEDDPGLIGSLLDALLGG